jgi:hypothetical protein
VDSPYGPLVAAHRHGALAPRGRATLVVRPEAVHLADGAPAQGTANHLRVTVEGILNVGSQLKVVTRTADGSELVARLPRTGAALARVQPGAEIWLTFGAEDAHVYPPAAPDHTTPQDRNP